MFKFLGIEEVNGYYECEFEFNGVLGKTRVLKSVDDKNVMISAYSREMIRMFNDMLKIKGEE